MVEHRSPKPTVGGSSPSCPAILWKLLHGIKRRCSNLYSSSPRRVQQKINRLRGAEVQHRRFEIVQGLISALPSAVSCTCGEHKAADQEHKGLEEKQLVFLHNPLAPKSGAKIARVTQTAGRIAAMFPKVQVSICATQSRDVLGLQQALVVVSKNCGISISRMKKLLRHGNILIADYVDGDHHDNIDAMVNGFLCSSYTEFEWVSNRLLKNQQAVLVPHAADDRFLGLDVRENHSRTFRCGYFGGLTNGLFVEQLNNVGALQAVESSVVALSGDFFAAGGWASQLLQYPVQYIARPSMQVRGGRFKPFNKGFQSAQLGQIVIGARFDAENRYWLRDDYPFYVEEETLDSCVAAIQRCRSAWESGDLAQARTVMQKLRIISCPVQNALDYRDALVRYLS